MSNGQKITISVVLGDDKDSAPKKSNEGASRPQATPPKFANGTMSRDPIERWQNRLPKPRDKQVWIGDPISDTAPTPPTIPPTRRTGAGAGWGNQGNGWSSPPREERLIDREEPIIHPPGPDGMQAEEYAKGSKKKKAAPKKKKTTKAPVMPPMDPAMAMMPPTPPMPPSQGPRMFNKGTKK
jgi:hypothetical protein